MTLHINFPTVMKMEFAAEIPITEEQTIEDVKQKIFETFWQIMSVFSQKHGKSDMVILRDLKHVEIKEMATLMGRIKEPFEVIFQDHPK